MHPHPNLPPARGKELAGWQFSLCLCVSVSLCLCVSVSLCLCGEKGLKKMLNTKNAQKQTESRRIAWRCRRGLLELDIVLQRFVAQYYEGLSVAELSAFDAMLALPDNDFWALVSSENAQPINLESLAVINKIKTLQHLVEN